MKALTKTFSDTTERLTIIIDRRIFLSSDTTRDEKIEAAQDVKHMCQDIYPSMKPYRQSNGSRSAANLHVAFKIFRTILQAASDIIKLRSDLKEFHIDFDANTDDVDDNGDLISIDDDTNSDEARHADTRQDEMCRIDHNARQDVMEDVDGNIDQLGSASTADSDFLPDNKIESSIAGSTRKRRLLPYRKVSRNTIQRIEEENN